MTEKINDEPSEVSTEMEAAPVQHKLYEKLKSYYPDREFASDNDAMDAAHEKLEEHDKYYDETEKLLQNISDAVDEDPEYAQVTALVGKGMSFREAVTRCIDVEDLQAVEGDPDYDALAEAKKQRASERESRASRMAEIEANSKESAAKVDQFAADNNLSEEETFALLQSVESVVTDIINGKITPDFLARMLTAENHDKEVEKATENAFIEGKNANIDAKKELDKKTPEILPDIVPTAAPVKTAVPRQKSQAEKFLEGTGL